jgi:Condensation domain
MERPLGALEQSQWLYDQIHPLHFAIVAKIRGQFTLDQLQNALSQVQQQHPLLRVRIATDKYGQPQYIEENNPIPIRWVASINEEQWQRELEVEMTQSFNWSTAPLARVVWVQSGLDSELIVLYHHAIADGISGAYLLGDIVRGLFESNFTRQELATAVSIEEAYGLSPEVHGVICAAFLCSLTNQQNPHRNSVASHPGMLDRSSRFLVKML